VLCTLLAAGCEAADQDAVESPPEQRSGPVRAAKDPAADAVTRRLAQRHAPLVLLAPRERWGPVGTKAFLRRSVLWWADAEKCPDRKVAVGLRLPEQRNEAEDWLYMWGLGRGKAYWRSPTDRRCDSADGRIEASDLTRPHQRAGRRPGVPLRQGFYLDLDDRAKARLRGPVAPRLAAPVYVERRDERFAGDRAIRLSYWMLFPVNAAARDRSPTASSSGAHEGDWERLDVVLAYRRRGSAPQPTAVTVYLGDAGARELPWSTVPEIDARTGRRAAARPVVTLAAGSHTPMLRRCQTCQRWHVWQRVVLARHEPWYGYGGAWGDVGRDSSSTGPLGPRDLPLLPPVVLTREEIRGSAPIRGR
jgi:hypothetical protein